MTDGATANVDPFTVEVIRHALTAAAEEMSAVVMRSARSPLLREAGDLSSTIMDGDGELIAQGHDVPVHLGVLSYTVKAFLERIPKARLKPGDIWFLNLPEVGGNHLPDVKAIRPIFHDGEIVAFAVSLAHWADMGGASPGSYYAAATDAWMEGLRISPLRVFANDQADPEKLDIILSNVRGRREREGDLLAQTAATRAADQRIAEIIERHGLATFQAAVATLHDLSEAQMRDVLRGLPDGRFEGEDFLDDGGPDDRPVGIRVSIDKRGDRATFDFSATDDAISGPLNTTPFVAGSAVFFAIRALAKTPIAINGGCYRPLTIVVRPGSVFDPGHDKPLVGGNHETSQRAVDAIFRALEPAIGERVSAGGMGSAGLLIFSGKRPDGRFATFYETHGGGEGARADRDGMPVVRVNLTNVMNTPIEVIEAEYGLRVERQSLRPGSGGAGRHRGGDGLVRAYRAIEDGIAMTSMFERSIVPPYGLRGGAAGAPMRVTLHRASGATVKVRGKQNIRLNQGDLVVVETPGGGGFGAPSDPAGGEGR
ncbi:hydantoinase B/oxoprolinase family protein [Phreatobacter stygius]|uniref:Hydantoinase B/oxoprolinase family protein n=1 Tax=Phreatobacter stygius TaxID=1940610 RepID=A0A4D7AW90_9HYPH|nr:hydantoinase B/oxoprolinase family protein [Phreatobacter stygius]QCI65934.1 hydantoinase B/oxoprolinase family protein [Phreatobacter stygius]